MLRAAIICAALAGTAAAAQTPPTAPDDAPIHDPADLKPEAPLPPDAIVPGAPGVAAIVCEADPAPIDASGAFGLSEEAARQIAASSPRRVVRVERPWTASPSMTGAGAALPVTFFKRGRTLIFDAQSEVLYLDRDHRRFTYTRSAPGEVTTWHGICRVEG